ncbi:MAG TPA: heat-inducible transcriptional repressor HrcA [Kofleriaceae bacterium]|jgi:heat-inducible transcriptional repressor|nr:heat-inducible transcriptional repressor HrcA [Kofleriaceae bacterium]
MADLSRRAQKILHAVVTEYLHGGDAVGSRTVTRRHDLGLSPATVRNVMADLEELGLLEQRHSSAGRVPTSTGLRFFIDSLLKLRGLTVREKDEIRERVVATSPDEVVQRASRLLSDLTQHAAVIITPDPAAQRLQMVEFVPLRDGKLIAVLVTTDGRIENRLIIDDVDPRTLDRIHNYLNQLLSGMTLDEVRDRVIREIGEDKNQYDDAVSAALRLGHAVFVSTPKSNADVVVSGHANLVDAELGQPGRADRMRELLRTLEDKETLIRLLDRTRLADGIQVFLGAETAMTALAGSSVVAMSYGPEEMPIGAIAVIGPMRMNYGKVMSVVDFTADTVSQLLAELGG